MARTKTKSASYFSHDSNAKDDLKIMIMIEELGLEAYGIFWMLIETLREQEDLIYPLKLLPSLARKYNTTIAKVEVVVRNYNLFVIEKDTFFYSNSLNKRMEIMHKKREQARIAGIKSGEARRRKEYEQKRNGSSTSVEQYEKEREKEKRKENKKENKKEKRTVEQDVQLLSNLTFLNVQDKSLHEIVDNHEVFEATGFSIQDLIIYSCDNREYLLKELEICSNG